MLFVAEPLLGHDEKVAIAQVINSGWITMGRRVREFELAFAAHHDVGDAVAVSSCTAGLHLVMRALGIGPGDEVLVPSLTFVATANAVLYVGATPVFVDIHSANLPHASPDKAVARCSARTKAIIVMHYGGYVVDLAPWRNLAQSRGLFLIEDAAHAVGVDGVGQATDAAVFSFFGNKNMTTAEGGMVVAREGAVLDDVRRMRSHGMTTSSWQRAQGQSLAYDVTTLGYNYRMDELRAAVGLSQLRRLNAWNDKRRRLSQVYRDLLCDRCPQVQVPFAESWLSACHIFPVVLPRGTDRHAVMQAMHDANVQTTVHYPPIHLFSYYREAFSSTTLPITEDFAAQELTLPLYPALEPEQAEAVVGVLAQCLKAR
jgi:dTDP-4-amino-4,6-dideoxygalactose transaminase